MSWCFRVYDHLCHVPQRLSSYMAALASIIVQSYGFVGREGLRAGLYLLLKRANMKLRINFKRTIFAVAVYAFCGIPHPAIYAHASVVGAQAAVDILDSFI